MRKGQCNIQVPDEPFCLIRQLLTSLVATRMSLCLRKALILPSGDPIPLGQVAIWGEEFRIHVSNRRPTPQPKGTGGECGTRTSSTKTKIKLGILLQAAAAAYCATVHREKLSTLRFDKCVPYDHGVRGQKTPCKRHQVY